MAAARGYNEGVLKIILNTFLLVEHVLKRLLGSNGDLWHLFSAGKIHHGHLHLPFLLVFFPEVLAQYLHLFSEDFDKICSAIP